MSNQKKDIVENVISLVAIILLVLGAIAAAMSMLRWAEQKACDHELGESVVVVEADCETEGLAEQECSKCGYVKQETLPIHHTVVATEEQPATCTQAGRTAGEVCLLCHEELSGREEIPALGGGCDYVAQADGGYTCSKCGTWYAERRLTDPAQFRVGEWYRFYIDPMQEYSEATILINLRRADSGCDGGYCEPGQTVDMDLPCVRIGLSTASQGKGYIFFSDGVWLSVDADVESGENYIDIYLDENVFTGAGDGTVPDIWFELTRETEATEITCVGGGYIVRLDGKPER